MSPDQGRRGTSGKGGGGKASGPAAARRLGLLIFGVAFLVLFVVVAIADGVGDPSIPSGDVALVEDAPGDTGEVTEAEVEHAIELAAAQAGEKRPQARRPQIRGTEGNGDAIRPRRDLDSGGGRRMRASR